MPWRHLERTFPGRLEIKTVKPVRDPRLRADYLLRIAMQGKEIRYYAEVKANVTKADKLLAMMRKGEFDHPLLLVTKYINYATGGRIEAEWDRIYRYGWKRIYQSASSIHFCERE